MKNLIKRMTLLLLISIVGSSFSLSAMQKSTLSEEVLLHEMSKVAKEIAEMARVSKKIAKRRLCLSKMLRGAALTNDTENINALLRDNTSLVNNSADQFGNTPLHIAASFGRFEAVEALLQEGANPSPINNFGQTPLDFASDEGFDNIETLLKVYI